MLAFDYIVVGGGSAGCVIARRLAERLPSAKIALIEAGKSDQGVSAILDLSRWSELLGTEYDYDFEIAPQTKGNSRIRHNRGKMLGGSSSMNSCIAFRAPASDLQGWLDLPQTQTDYEAVLSKVHIEQTEFDNPLLQAFIEAGKQYGLPEVDFSAPFDAGVGKFYLNKKRFIRQSSSIAYLHPLEALPSNLTLLLETPVTRLILHHQRVVGVETIHGTYLATQEVIVSAGAFCSPKLLLLSGIGPAEQLKIHQIPLAIHLPGVGENLLDHPESVMTWELNRPMPPETVQKYEAGAFVRIYPDSPFADIMMHMGLEPFDMQTKDKGFPTTTQGFSLTPNVTHARSRGTVRLRSDDPLDAPLIDFRYYCDPEGHDLKTMIAGLRAARDIARQPALAAWITRELAPGVDWHEDAELANYIQQTSNTVYHPAGTCRMGSGQDPLAVVDNDFKVHGVQGLRVVDASVFPHMIGVNPNLTIMMLGERCARLITAHHSKQTETVQEKSLDLASNFVIPETSV